MFHVKNIITLAVLYTFVSCGGLGDSSGGSGLVEADEVIVSAETSGQIQAVFFGEGTALKEGDTLLVIDGSRLELQMASMRAGREVATANLETARIKVQQATEAEEYAKSEFERASRLLKSGTATQKQFEQLQFEHSQAVLSKQAALANVRTLDAEIKKLDSDIDRFARELKDCYPLAPLSGTVTEKYIDAGELLAVGRPVAKIVRLDTVWVKVYLPAATFANVVSGTGARISTETGGREYDGTVVWTADEAEFTPKNVQTAESRAGLVYAVKVRIPNTDRRLKVGMPVFVSLEIP
ncbi:MAG TPA: HlyD family efflux transporter periplasmic adaptor subunit [Acidobacteriota bacterium]|nr:HlyD family efflux transporter periplasmic adaptor subunit [Acidobacteriota bacterium]